MLNLSNIIKPTLIIDVQKTRQNISHMTNKAAQSQIQLRPHFKTHQSATIGKWFREVSVHQITVSSVEMARYFAHHGWQDILIAFPINVRELTKISSLAEEISLHLLVDNEQAAHQLSHQLSNEVLIWIEIDAGYGRTGVPWDQLEQITAVSQAIMQLPHLQLAGLLTHDGSSYKARGKTAVSSSYAQTVQRLQHVQAHLHTNGISTAISIGDTPACSLLERFEGVDEIRPGNFVFYDMMQVQIGACSIDDISIAAACPVVGKYPDQQKLAIYGGAVHLSKEAIVTKDGQLRYGAIALPVESGWKALNDDSYVYSLSQEHGLVHASNALLSQVKIGDLLLILPVHACLTANLLKGYRTLSGKRINMANIVGG